MTLKEKADLKAKVINRKVDRLILDELNRIEETKARVKVRLIRKDGTEVGK